MLSAKVDSNAWDTNTRIDAIGKCLRGDIERRARRREGALTWLLLISGTIGVAVLDRKSSVLPLNGLIGLLCSTTCAASRRPGLTSQLFNGLLAARVASTAITASAAVDAERSRLYLDLIMISLSENAHGALQNMNSLGFEDQSYFARKYVAQGRAQGRVEMVLELLALRFGPLTEAIQEQVRAAEDSQLHTLAKELLTAHTPEEVLKSLR